MKLIKIAQQPGGIPIPPILLQHLELFFRNKMREAGWVPRAADKQLDDHKRRIIASGRYNTLFSLWQELDQERAVQELLQLFVAGGIEDKNVPAIVSSLLSMAYLIVPDAVGQLLYPYGSARNMMVSITTAIATSRYDLSVEHAADLAEQIGIAIRVKYFNDKLMKDTNARIRATGGMSMDQIGDAYLALVMRGAIHPSMPVEKQMAVLDKFLPAINAVAALRDVQGKETSITDAVDLALQMNAQLGWNMPDRDTLAKMVYTLKAIHDYRAQTGLRGGMPGALAHDEAMKQFANFLQQAERSIGARRLGSVVQAYHDGKLVPGTLAYRIAERALYGLAPVDNLAEAQYLLTYNGTAELLRQGGVPNNLVNLYLHPAVGSGMLTPTVVMAAQQMQYWELEYYTRKKYDALMAAYGHPTGETRELIEKIARGQVAAMFGLTPPQVEQILRPPPVPQIKERVEAMMEQPPRYPQPAVSRIAEALRYAKDSKDIKDALIKFIGMFFGYLPAKKEEQPTERGQAPESPAPAAPPAAGEQPQTPPGEGAAFDLVRPSQGSPAVLTPVAAPTVAPPKPQQNDRS